MFLVMFGVIAAYVVVFDPRIFPGCNLDDSRWREARQLVTQGESSEAFEKAEPEVEDVVKCDDLVYGRSRAEVEQLLGSPDRRAKRSKFFFYDVGVPEDLSDYPGLTIVFDPAGEAEKAFVNGYVER